MRLGVKLFFNSALIKLAARCELNTAKNLPLDFKSLFAAAAISFIFAVKS